MENFNRGDFLYDRKSISRKYVPIGGFTEGTVYKISDDLVAKRFKEPRDLYVKEVHDSIILCNPQSILTSNDFLIDDNKVYAQFIKYFNGTQSENVNNINFDVLLKFVKNILIDIEALTECNIQMEDITPSSFIYSDKDMKLFDTTKYCFSDKNKYDLYNHNISTVFNKSDYFNFSLNNNIIRNIIRISNNFLLEEMKYNYEDYYNFLVELRKTLQNITGVKVNTINDGYALIKSIK